MRHALLIAVMLAIPLVAAAQTGTAPGQLMWLPRITPALPRISPPLTPLRPTPAPDVWSAPPQDAGRVRPPYRGGRSGGRHGRSAPSIVYIGPGYAWGYPYYIPSPPPAIVEHAQPVSIPREAPAEGIVRLDVGLGGDAQVFVDGYFAGTLGELGGELVLAPGPHRIELRAEGFRNFQFEVLITAGRAITFSGRPEPEGSGATAAPQADAPRAAAPPAAAATVYFIPGCYLGNVPPKDARLPATCDQSRVETWEPAPAR